jgi:hypothetical protein
VLQEWGDPSNECDRYDKSHDVVPLMMAGVVGMISGLVACVTHAQIVSLAARRNLKFDAGELPRIVVGIPRRPRNLLPKQAVHSDPFEALENRPVASNLSQVLD